MPVQQTRVKAGEPKREIDSDSPRWLYAGRHHGGEAGVGGPEPELAACVPRAHRRRPPQPPNALLPRLTRLLAMSSDISKADQIAYRLYTKLSHVLYDGRVPTELLPGRAPGKVDKWVS